MMTETHKKVEIDGKVYIETTTKKLVLLDEYKKHLAGIQALVDIGK